ncbi:MAG: hypothetical protein ACKOYJ_06955 [Planctomycetia bacterium]
MSRLVRVLLPFVAAILPMAPVPAAQGGLGAEPPVMIRVEWGGGRPRAWAGTIRVIDEPQGPAGDGILWQSLCADADAAASIRAAGDMLHLDDPRPRDTNGIQCVVQRWQTARIVARIAPAGEPLSVTEIDVSVAEVLADMVPRPLDAEGNRLTIRRADGDAIRVAHAGGGWPAISSVRRPGETVRLEIHPLLVSRAGSSAPRELSMRVRDVTANTDLRSESQLIHPRTGDAVPVGDGLSAQAFEPVAFEVTLPDRDAVCAVTLELIERGGLRWSRPVASRTVELVAVSEKPSSAPTGDWKVFYELDPASPRLHERLRRLSGSIPSISMPSLPMPAVKLPQLPFPSLARPDLSRAKLPAVPLPSVSAIVPRISGLLLSGHSTVEPHPLGPMLQLPPARAADEPAWEGIVIAGVEIGMPHFVEIEYPLDRRAMFGVSVLETNAGGSLVQQRHAGGFEVVPPGPSSDAKTLGRHSFIFWPSTRNPVVMVMNVSPHMPAFFGKVRVFAGPSRVPRMHSIAVAPPGVDPRTARRVHGFVSTPAGLGFGAGGSVGADAARLPEDWNGIMMGVRRSAEWLTAQGVGGAMITVYRDGGAIWPSECTQGSPRWHGGGGETSGRDVLDVVCRVYGREGLRVVPALSFNAPLPALEDTLARHDGTATGIATVGADGRPRRLAGSPSSIHYNILDPRVQGAVESIVGELAARLRKADAVDGVAILLGHDGWLHLPGVEWGLDDVTFGRFATTAGVESPRGADRHARRASLVAGPLREAWLAWRIRELASFHARLAAIVTKDAAHRSLYVAPTTLLAMGDVAARLRPSLSGRENGGLWREIGVDPESLTADSRIMFLSPHVHDGAGGLVERGAIDEANRSPAIVRGVASAARRGVVALDIPMRARIDDVVPHGPFGSAAADGAIAVHAVRSGNESSRPFAEAFLSGDVETIFDMGLMYAQPSLEGVVMRQAFTALPPRRLAMVEARQSPIVVCSGESQRGTAMIVVNASDSPVQADVGLSTKPAIAADAVDGGRFTVSEAGILSVPLEPWGIRSIVVDAGARPCTAKAVFEGPVRAAVASRLEDVRKRCDAIAQPPALAALDNPDFDLPGQDGAVTGWEIVERQRGSVVSVPSDRAEGARAVVFSSTNGLATLRSNPFPPPPTGRVSVAAWLRLAGGGAQPPLRVAVEGLDRTGEYYRFAPVGGLPGGSPVGAAWSQFVLQIDELPSEGLESLRVRFDLMGPGAVQIDDVRVFGVAFDASQRARLAQTIARAEERLAADDLGGCAELLDSFWPRFLVAHVPLNAEQAHQPGGQPMARPPRRWTWR